MNEILVEEENTVYELDPECLGTRRTKTTGRKEETGKQENDNYRMQKRPEKGIRTICGSSVCCYW